jgi:hypothetical protein
VINKCAALQGILANTMMAGRLYAIVDTMKGNSVPRAASDAVKK